jgi:hypothetical protein
MISIELWRSGWEIEHEGITGEISEVWVGDKLLCWAVERNTKGWSRLKLGTYTVKMENSPNAKVKVGKDTYAPRKQFRVYGHDVHGGTAPILIHAANYPGQLEGCIGPGMVATEDGVDQSEVAMQKLFEVFGGFKVGTEGGLMVTSG